MSEFPVLFPPDERSPAASVFSAQVQPGLVRLHGELDCATSPMLETALAGMDCVRGAIIVDLEDLRFLDAAGIGAISQAARTLGERGRVVLRRPQPSVVRTIRIAGFERWLEQPRRGRCGARTKVRAA